MPVALRPAAFAAATGLIRIARSLACVLFAVVSLPVFAHGYAIGSLKIDQPQDRPTLPGVGRG